MTILPGKRPLILTLLAALLTISSAALAQSLSPIILPAIKKYIQSNIVHALEPDSSALLFYIPSECLIDSAMLLEVLMKMRGTLHHTTFTTAAAETILNQEWLTKSLHP